MGKKQSETSEMTYETAKSALDKIVREIQNENTSIDLLAEKIKQAQELISFCQSKLRNIEAKVKGMIGDEEE